VENLVLPVFRHVPVCRQRKNTETLISLFINASPFVPLVFNVPNAAYMYATLLCDVITNLEARRRELQQLNPAQPNYESCRRSLEQAIEELVRLRKAIDDVSQGH
jgi:hypothetical protein